jgi:anti-anti-sigma regulatory factor
VLVVAAQLLRERGGELVLLRPGAAVARVLEAMGAGQVITVVDPAGT